MVEIEHRTYERCFPFDSFPRTNPLKVPGSPTPHAERRWGKGNRVEYGSSSPDPLHQSPTSPSPPVVLLPLWVLQSPETYHVGTRRLGPGHRNRSPMTGSTWSLLDPWDPLPFIDPTADLKQDTRRSSVVVRKSSLHGTRSDPTSLYSDGSSLAAPPSPLHWSGRQEHSSGLGNPWGPTQRPGDEVASRRRKGRVVL